MQRAFAHLQSLAGQAGDAEELIAVLDRSVETSRLALEKCLNGLDSFDTLAFLRLSASPWDFSAVRESDSHVATSLAAQDVVALAALGMGLPRTPLTGKNSGQLNIGRAMQLAGDIVAASQTRALVQGHQTVQPLGALAGEFLGYELSVRGRQYQSVATELNTDLFGDQPTSKLLKDTLGFTLADVRSVRDSSVGLLNERLFGARDRLARAVRQGTPPAADELRRDMNLMTNECRLFGAVTATDVATRAGVNEDTARSVLDFFTFSRPDEAHLDLISRFSKGELPAPWGGISDGDEFLILTGFLGEDELRRNIERGLKGGRAWSKYDRRRAKHSEAQTAVALSGLFNSTAPRWQGQEFIGPVRVADSGALSRTGDRRAVETRTYESDLLYVVDGVAVCVEVKAGSVTDKARAGNPQRLASDLQKTFREGNEQADRLTNLIRTNHGVWDEDNTWIDLSSVQEVHTIIVMLDDLGPLSLSMNELALQGIIETDEVPWIVTLHDLTVMSRTFDHPAQFLEYLRRRRGRKLATMVEGVDELDMFMWFLEGGMYFDPNPDDTAAQIPYDRPIKKADQRKYDNQPKVRLGTLTDPLDAWIYATEGLSSADAPKPARNEEPWVEEYLTISARAQSPGWLRFGADLVGLSGDAQTKLGKDLRAVCRRASESDKERSLTTHGTTSEGAWLLTVSSASRTASTEHLPIYLDDKHYQTQAARSMLLLYDTNAVLRGSIFLGTPQERTNDRDAAVAASPLHSLAKTFSTAPPSARRTTRQLRGKRPKKKRR